MIHRLVCFREKVLLAISTYSIQSQISGNGDMVPFCDVGIRKFQLKFKMKQLIRNISAYKNEKRAKRSTLVKKLYPKSWNKSRLLNKLFVYETDTDFELVIYNKETYKKLACRY